MEDLIIGIDTDIFLWINSWHAPYWDRFMYLASGKVIWIPFYACILYAIYLSYGLRTAALMLFMTVLAVTAADQLCATLIRPYIERLRPTNLDNPISGFVHIVDGYRGGKYGFPSCHAANTFALGTLTSLLFRRWQFTLFIFLWALIVCYSRIYLGVHYPGDILAGLSIGIVCGALAYTCAGIVLGLFVYSKPAKREARKIVATYRRGSPNIHSHVGNRVVTWRPTYLPVAVGTMTVMTISVVSAFGVPFN